MSNLVVYKSNKVVEAAYKLSLNEQKLILFCIAKNDSRQPLSTKDKFEITANEFAELTGIEVNHAYESLQDVAENLFNRYVIIDNPDPERPKLKRTRTRWVCSIDYIPDSGALELYFAPKMLPYLSELKTQFTRYELANIGGMTSTYGVRLYELLSQYRTFGRREIAIDWIKKHFEIEDAYKSIADFKKYVIVPAVENINKHSDLVLHAPIYKKTGRNVTHIIFDFSTKEKSSSTKKQKIKSTKPLPVTPVDIDNVQYFVDTLNRFRNNVELRNDIIQKIPSDILEKVLSVVTF